MVLVVLVDGVSEDVDVELTVLDEVELLRMERLSVAASSN